MEAAGQDTTAQALPRSQHPTLAHCGGASFAAFGHAGITILGSWLRLLYLLSLKEHEFFRPGKLSRLFGFCLLVSISTRKQWLLSRLTAL